MAALRRGLAAEERQRRSQLLLLLVVMRRASMAGVCEGQARRRRAATLSISPPLGRPPRGTQRSRPDLSSRRCLAVFSARALTSSQDGDRGDLHSVHKRPRTPDERRRSALLELAASRVLRLAPVDALATSSPRPVECDCMLAYLLITAQPRLLCQQGPRVLEEPLECTQPVRALVPRRPAQLLRAAGSVHRRCARSTLLARRAAAARAALRGRGWIRRRRARAELDLGSCEGGVESLDGAG